MSLTIILVVAAACCGVTLSNDVDKPKHYTSTAAPTTEPVTSGTTVSPPSDIWTASYKNRTLCILLSANITLTYNSSSSKELQSLTIPPPMNGSSADGVCGTMKQNITIVYSGFDLNVTFNFIMNNNSMYHMDSFQLTARNGKLNDSVARNVSEFWSEDKDKLFSYRCNATECLYNDNGGAAGHLTKLTVSNMQLEAFQNKTKAEFSNDVTECKEDRTISNLVPIIVGAALGALILIVLIAYLIGRRRSRRGYEQV